MLKRTLIFLILGLAQAGCYISEESGGYKPVELSSEWRQDLERSKRELLTLEDVTVGDGPIATWGRKISADIEVRYADKTLVYRGPAVAYFGMQNSVFIHNDIDDDGILSLQQDGIILGLNGMAVGGKRHMVIAPNLVCYERAAGESTSTGADPGITCRLTRRYLKDGGIVEVRKETLIVEATLTASCIPVFMEIPFIYKGQFRCRDSDTPKPDPSAQIWRIY